MATVNDNVFGSVIPKIFALNALKALRPRLRFASRVYMGPDAIRNTVGMRRGNTINMHRPGRYASQAVTAGQNIVPQEMVTEDVSLKLDQWHEVTGVLGDDDMAFIGPGDGSANVGSRFIAMHIPRMALAISRALTRAGCVR